MKIISSILVFVTILFSTSICIPELEADANESKEEVCSTSHCCSSDLEEKNEWVQTNTKEENNDKGCCGNSCNPFKVCCSVFWIPEQAKNLVNEPVTNLKNQKFFYKFQYSSSYTSDFWQPPKFG